MPSCWAGLQDYGFWFANLSEGGRTSRLEPRALPAQTSAGGFRPRINANRSRGWVGRWAYVPRLQRPSAGESAGHRRTNPRASLQPFAGSDGIAGPAEISDCIFRCECRWRAGRFTGYRRVVDRSLQGNPTGIIHEPSPASC